MCSWMWLLVAPGEEVGPSSIHPLTHIHPPSRTGVEAHIIMRIIQQQASAALLGQQVFPTHSFPFRFFTTVLGFIFVNTYRIHICTNAQPEDKTFKVHLNE